MLRPSQWLPLAAVALALGIAACADEEREGDGGDNAVDAREENVVRLADISYRVVLFRELNPRVTPDSELVARAAPEQGVGLYAAFVRACNEGGEEAIPTDRVLIEDAFGNRLRPRRNGVDATLAYQPRPLEPGACIPRPGSPAERTFDGAAVVFEVPFDAAQRRPLVLELHPQNGGDPARVQLDL